MNQIRFKRAYRIELLNGGGERLAANRSHPVRGSVDSLQRPDKNNDPVVAFGREDSAYLALVVDDSAS